MILKVCEEHRDNIDAMIAKKVRDISIKRNAEDYLGLLKPITVALDKMQSDNCKLSEARAGATGGVLGDQTPTASCFIILYNIYPSINGHPLSGKSLLGHPLPIKHGAGHGG